MSTDDRGAPGAPRCEHCGAPLEPGRITCVRCGEARSLGAPIGGTVPPAEPPPPAPTETVADPAPAAGPAAEEDEFDIGNPYRDIVHRRPQGPAERSRTALLVGGLIGLILVVLVAAAALWALRQHGGSADF